MYSVKDVYHQEPRLIRGGELRYVICDALRDLVYYFNRNVTFSKVAGFSLQLY